MTKQHFLPKAIEIFNATLPDGFKDFKFVHNDSVLLFTIWATLHMTATDASLYLGMLVAGATFLKKGVEIYLLLKNDTNKLPKKKPSEPDEEEDK